MARSAARLSRRLADAGPRGDRRRPQPRRRHRRFCAGEDGPDPARRSTAAAISRSRGIARRSSSTRRGRSSSAAATCRAACIAAGAHYLDLADARDFVARIGTLDAAARAAGVAIISGASSVPALVGRGRAPPRRGDGGRPRRRDRAQHLEPRRSRRLGRRGDPVLCRAADPALAGPGLADRLRLARDAPRTVRSRRRPSSRRPPASPCARCRTSICCRSGCRAGRRSPSAPAPIRGSRISASPRPPGWCAGA